MNGATEIRKLPPSNVRELVQILELADSWKKLMEIIPKKLDKENCECNWNEENPRKYHSDHFRLIENASKKYQRPCSEILLDEWGTSGRVRPTLGHLLHLLKKADIYRAADFVAVNLLNRRPPERPKEGPAAHVHVTFMLDERDELEHIIDNINCNSSDIENLNSNGHTIENNIEANMPPLPKYNNTPEVSDMMKFSVSNEQNCSVNSEISSDPMQNIPQINSLLQNSNSEMNNNLSESDNVPRISALLNSESRNLPQISALLQNEPEENSLSETADQNIPQISALLSPIRKSEVVDINIPHISELLSSKHESTFHNDSTPTLNSTPGQEYSENAPILSSMKESQMIPQISALLQSEIKNKSLLSLEEKSVADAGIPHISALLSLRISENNSDFELNNDIPQISALLRSEAIPQISGLLSVHKAISENIPPSENRPQISALLNSHSPPILEVNNLLAPSSEHVPQISALLISQGSQLNASENIPQISALLSSKPETESRKDFSPTLDTVPSISESSQHSPQSVPSGNHNGHLPQISISTTEESQQMSPTASNELPTFVTLASSPNNSSNRRPQCHSPLPNLSLNTLLPHYNYYELENHTSNFDETPYPMGRFLGSGGFGSVFLCLGLSPKPRAVKRLHLNGVAVVNVDDAITKQFRNEVEVLFKYKHENLLSICGYSCDGPTYCLMYEYISGGALNCRLEKHKEELQWRDRLRIASGTAEAVAYLHTAFSTHLIHRDIKTANILLDAANKPKLGDFGLIKLSPNQQTTVSTTIIGTSVYMAPETCRAGDVTMKTDTFSFGVVILELLTALAPFDLNREARDLISHVEEMCEDSSIIPLLDWTAGTWVGNGMNVAEELFAIANRCLEEKKRRPNMVEVQELLNKLIALTLES